MSGPPQWSGDAAELVGSTLAGRYAIDSVIGEGAMGVVYGGHHLSLERAVAIKILRPELGRRAEFRERFLREAQAASRIGHPNVVQILDFGQDGPLAFSVMELLVGEDLGQCLARVGRLRWSDAAPVLLAVARALGAAHACRIVHRDIKPANVMIVGREGGALDVKVLDFGIAKLGNDGPDGLTRHGAIMGTVAYMAPEQARGGIVDHRVDVYAMGALMYRTLTGVLPGPSDLIERFARPVYVPPPRTVVPDLPVGVEMAILRALAEAPGDRFQSMSELEAALVGASSAMVEPTWALSGEPGLVRTPTYVLPELPQHAAGAEPTAYLPQQVAPRMATAPSIAIGGATGYTFATPPPRRGVMVAIVATVAVLALGSGATAGVLLAGDHEEREAGVVAARVDAKPAIEADVAAPPRLEPAQPEPAPQPEPAQVEPAQVEPEPAQVEPAQPEPAQPEPAADTKRPRKSKKPEVADPTLARLQIEVASALPPAAVRVDGKRRGRTPVVAKVPAGSHTVEFAWPDGRSFSQRVELGKGQRLLVKGYAR